MLNFSRSDRTYNWKVNRFKKELELISATFMHKNNFGG